MAERILTIAFIISISAEKEKEMLCIQFFLSVVIIGSTYFIEGDESIGGRLMIIQGVTVTLCE